MKTRIASLAVVSVLTAACQAGSPAATPAGASASSSPVPAPGVASPAPVGSAPAGAAASSPIPAAAPSAPAASSVAVTPAIRAIVDAPDRVEDDRKLDAGRHPAETLAFFGIAPGMHVAEVIAGGGYTTELLARAVAPNGVVYAENPKGILGFVGKPWAERLTRPALKDVVRVDREVDDPFPSAAKNLDAVLLVLNYHDTVWQGANRDKMNAAVFGALKPGGVYGIIDHSARAGAGLADVQTLHRIEESDLRSEVEKAGFKLQAEADFLRNPSDPRDWSTSPRVAGEKRGTSDRFVLKFVKP
jgi:predicted methyltransferase